VLILLIGRIYDVTLGLLQVAWHVHSKFHDDRFRNSSIVKGISSTTSEVVVLVLLMSGICVSLIWDDLRWRDIFITGYKKIDSGVQAISRFCLRKMLGAAIFVLRTGVFMVCDGEMISYDIIFLPSFMKIGVGVQVILRFCFRWLWCWYYWRERFMICAIKIIMTTGSGIQVISRLVLQCCNVDITDWTYLFLFFFTSFISNQNYSDSIS
jgi:hypothetical protein